MNNQNLKTSIEDVIKGNGNQEITGDILQDSLVAIINHFGSGSVYGGFAVPSTNPVNTDVNTFYLAKQPGTYTNFGGYVLGISKMVIFSNKTGVWVAEDFLSVKSIIEVSKIAEVGLVNTYRIYYTDLTYDDFEVTNGESIPKEINQLNPSSIEKAETGKSIFNYLKTISSDGENLILEGSNGNENYTSDFTGWDVFNGSTIDANGANLPANSIPMGSLAYKDLSFPSTQIRFVIEVTQGTNNLYLIVDDSADPVYGLEKQLNEGINIIDFDAVGITDKTVIFRNKSTTQNAIVKNITILTDAVSNSEIPLKINVKDRKVLKKVSNFQSSDFVSSSTNNITSGVLNLTASGLTQFDWHTLHEDADLEFLYKENTASYSFFGFRSQNQFGYESSVFAMYATQGTQNGRILICNKDYIEKHISTSINTNYAVGDVMRMVINRFGLKYTVTVFNQTKGWSISTSIHCTPKEVPTVPNNESKPSVYLGAGSISIYEYSMISLCGLVDKYIAGDSITMGADATEEKYRYASLLNGNVLVSGGGADTTVNIVNRLSEIIAINPKYVLLMISGNDKLFGVSDATYQANLINIRNTLTDAGIQVVHLFPTPRTHATGIINFIKNEASFITDLKIDTNTPLRINDNPDDMNPIYSDEVGLLHPNNLGMAKIAEIINDVI